MGITLSSSGKFRRSRKWLERILKMDIRHVLNKYGERGVEKLRELTPRDTGETARSWYYEVHVHGDTASVSWWNDHVNEGVPIALLIEYGHVTGWGGYVPPHPYISEALGPVIEALENEIWEEVKSGR